MTCAECSQAALEARIALTDDAPSGDDNLEHHLVTVQLTACDAERLHEIGAIQDTGFLVAVRPDLTSDTATGLTIVALSENLSDAPWVQETDMNRLVNRLMGKDVSFLLGNTAAQICHQVSTQTLAIGHCL